MRKQAKLVAVLSAAALLAVGASMTSFAATPHWDMEDGEWVYLDRNGDKVSDVWKKSNGQWYYLDSDGYMAKDTVIEDDDDKYYVGEDGARVSNAWVSMDNDDLLEDDDEMESIETVWMYFGANGKALGAGSDQGEIKKLSYGDGQSGYFIFNADGYMLSGWKVWEKNGALYYLGNQNEGWARTNFQYLQVDPDLEAFAGVSEADEEFHDEEWFFFKSDGKAVRDDTQKYNGRVYAFDQWGRMVDRWVYNRSSNSDMTNEGGSSSTYGIASQSSTDLIGTRSDSASFYREEEGGRDKNWILAYPKTSYDNYSDDEYWFYLDSKGRPYRAVDPDWYPEYADKIHEDGPGSADRKDDDNAAAGDADSNAEVAAKAIKSYTYLFNEKGVMLTGLFELTNVPKGTSTDKMNGLYFFTIDGNHGSNEGKMVTNKKVKIDVHGDPETYFFSKSGAAFKNVIINGTVYGEDGQLVNEYGDGSTYQIVKLGDIASDETWVDSTGKSVVAEGTTGATQACVLADKSGKVLISGKNKEVLVNENGKIKQSGTATDINEQKVTVSGYKVTKTESK